MFILQISFVIAQKKNVVIDSITKKHIPFVRIIFNDNDGIYSDENGFFDLKNEIDSVTINTTGYNIKKFSASDSLFILSPVKIESKVKLAFKQSRSFVNQGFWHDDYLMCMQPFMSVEIASYIPNEQTNFNKQMLTNIKLPVKTATKVILNNKITDEEKKQPFKTVILVQFYKNNNKLPGEVLYDKRFVTTITEKSEDFVILNLDDSEILIPKEGLFISLVFLGIDPMTNHPFKPFNENIKSHKISKAINPPIPITGEINEDRTFIRLSFDTKNKWNSFTTFFSRYTALQNYEKLNIGMGYEIKVYE